MPTSPIIVAYDGSPNADDAVALGNQLAQLTGAPLALAHVYRTPSQSPRDGAGAVEGRAKLARGVADEVLSRGARLADGDVVLIAHGHLLRVLTARYLRLGPAEGRLFWLGTGTLCLLGTEHAEPVIISWNLPPSAPEFPPLSS